MGKALVIEGLTVRNPLCVVTFTVEVISLTIDNSSLSMTTGDTSTITATVVTSDGTSLSPTFTSSDTSVAGVSSSGNTATITAVARGNATITVRAGSQTVTCSVAVAAAPADELAAYYTANQTITDADKTAMNALVTGMSTAGIWAKVKRFYPMLGSTLHDLFLEVKEDASKGFSESSTYIANYFTAQTNAVSGSATSGNLDGNNSDDPMQISRNNVTMATAFELSALASITIYNARTTSSAGLDSFIGSDTYGRISIANSGNSPMNQSTALDRRILATVTSTTAGIYFNGSKVLSKELTSLTDGYLKKAYQLFLGEGIYKFLIIMDALTDSEAQTLNGLLETFYAATGKRSASS